MTNLNRILDISSNALDYRCSGIAVGAVLRMLRTTPSSEYVLYNYIVLRSLTQGDFLTRLSVLKYVTHGIPPSKSSNFSSTTSNTDVPVIFWAPNICASSYSIEMIY